MAPRNTRDSEATRKEHRPTCGGENETLAQETVDTLNELSDLRIFGYGSILWNTGFGYDTAEVGYIEGYARRFWQGNTTHRGTPESPGRVATLVKESESQVWGMMYHVTGTAMMQNCLEHLGVRECTLGGYSCQLLPFTPKSDAHHTDDDVTQHLALTFIASPDSEHYLGPTGLDEIANQVVATQGMNGSNSEYVVRLAEFVRANIPEDKDEHLFELDQKVRKRLHAMNLDKMSFEKIIHGSALQRTESSSNNHTRRRSSKTTPTPEMLKLSETIQMGGLDVLKL